MTSLSAARSLPVRGASRAAAALGFGQAKAPSTFATSSALFAVACSSSSSLFARSSSSHQHHRSSSEEHLFASSFDRSSSSHHRRRSSSEEHFFGSSSFACRGFAASPSSVGAGPFSGPEGRHDETKSKPERGGTTNPEASNQAAATFGVLSAAWAGTAAALLFAPEATLSWGFAVSAFPADGGVSALVPLARSLGAAQLVGAAGLWALRDGALDGSAARPSFRRLSLGLAAASATGAVSALVGAEAMSGAGLVSAVAAFGSTVAALARFWSEALPPSTAALDEAAARRRAAGSSALTSAPPNALLMTLAVAALAGGAAYIVAPAATLAPVLGPTASLSGPAGAGAVATTAASSSTAAGAAALSTGPAPAAVALWRTLGGGLVGVVPAVFITVKEANESGGVAAGAPPARLLASAMAAGGAAHALALWPLFHSAGGTAAVGGALPLAIGTWAVVSGTAAWAAATLPGGHGPAVGN